MIQFKVIQYNLIMYLLPPFMRRDLELVNLFIETIIFSYHIFYENIAKYLVRRQTDHGQTELDSLLVKKWVLNEINKSRYIGTTFEGPKKDQKDIKIKAYQN